MASKNELVNHLADNLEGVTKKLAGEAIDAIFDHIASTLSGGERVQIPGFGAFDISERKERQGRNPQTGAAMTIKASKGVRFKAGKSLKDAVNG